MVDTLKTWTFKMDNDRYVQMVLDGNKSATCYRYEHQELNQIDEQKILLFSNEKQACITKTTDIIITEFKNITSALALLDNQIQTWQEWRNEHITYFESISDNFNDESKVVFELFEVVENLIEKRKQLAKTIVEINQDIFGEVTMLEEVNAGFNNTIFNINDNFILKLGDCKNLFETEVKFYQANHENTYIPTFYKYDKLQSDKLYFYEIIERIKGQTLYYHWYKMNEMQREETICSLMKVIKQFHFQRYENEQWLSIIKNTMLENLKSAGNMFTKQEKEFILKSVYLYDRIFVDNRYAFIHNDLHFDNIMVNTKSMKLIDFNDACIAPIDYDLRILYMCQSMPKRWANIEVDGLQKREDYLHIWRYIKRHYTELNEIKYLEERMSVYTIMNEMNLLPKFRSLESKRLIIDLSLKLLDNPVLN